MPFMLYRARAEGTRTAYEYLRRLQLAGSSGPLAAHARSQFTGGAIASWHAADLELLEQVHDVDPAEYRIVVDLKPHQKENVSLYRLREAWGYSYDLWTPVAFHLETIFVDRHEADPQEFKRCFVDEGRRVSISASSCISKAVSRAADGRGGWSGV